MISIDNIIKKFNPISLKEMDGVKLLNRVDTKYLCSLDKLADILKDLIAEYKILEINKKRLNNYQTIYYDTQDFKMYHEHQNGKLNRYKIREREYIDSGLDFLEVKFKNNKKRTIKTRIIRNENLKNLKKDEIVFLDSKSPFSYDELEIKLYNRFQRITLTNQKERVTIDMGLEFINSKGVNGLLSSIAIIEVKQSKFSINSGVVKVLKKHQLRPCSFSKYCIGTTLVYPQLKSNRFKANILLINKLSA